MKPISLQLYTVREAAAQDFVGVLKQVAAIGYKGVEFAGLHGMCPVEVRKIIDDLGMVASSAHMAMPTAENAGQLIDECKALGVPKLISGFWIDDLATQESCAAAAARVAAACEALEGSGIAFGLHNHWAEFDHKIDGQYPEEILLAAHPGAFAELDVYWSTVGGADTPAVVSQLKSRIPLLHIKDGPVDPPQPHTAVGKGKLDMPAIIAAADPKVLEWLIVELDSCATDMMEAVADSYTYLVGSGLAAGNK